MTDQPRDLVLDRTAQGEREWVDQEARRREDAFEHTRKKAIANRRATRALRTLLQRHQRVAAELARMSTVPAGNVEPSRGGSEGIGPPKQQTLDLSHPERLMEIAVAAYEAVLDEQQGLGVLRSIDGMIAEEKDRMILLDLEGWSPAEIEVIYQGKLGSATTIRRVRRKANRSPKDGRPLRFAIADVDSGGVDL